MYTEFAHYCQLMNPREDYATEAPQWTDVLRKHLGPSRHPSVHESRSTRRSI
jgi:hypothetical protein